MPPVFAIRRAAAVSRGAGSRRSPGPPARRARWPGSSARARRRHPAPCPTRSRPAPRRRPPGPARRSPTSGTDTAFGSSPRVMPVSLAAARATTPSALPNGASAASSPCTSAAIRTAGADVVPVTRVNRPDSRGPGVRRRAAELAAVRPGRPRPARAAGRAPVRARATTSRPSSPARRRRAAPPAPAGPRRCPHAGPPAGRRRPPAPPRRGRRAARTRCSRPADSRRSTL